MYRKIRIYYIIIKYIFYNIYNIDVWLIWGLPNHFLHFPTFNIFLKLILI